MNNDREESPWAVDPVVHAKRLKAVKQMNRRVRVIELLKDIAVVAIVLGAVVALLGLAMLLYYEPWEDCRKHHGYTFCWQALSK